MGYGSVGGVSESWGWTLGLHLNSFEVMDSFVCKIRCSGRKSSDAQSTAMRKEEGVSRPALPWGLLNVGHIWPVF